MSSPWRFSQPHEHPVREGLVRFHRPPLQRASQRWWKAEGVRGQTQPKPYWTMNVATGHINSFIAPARFFFNYYRGIDGLGDTLLRSHTLSSRQKGVLELVQMALVSCGPVAYEARTTGHPAGGDTSTILGKFQNEIFAGFSCPRIPSYWLSRLWARP